MKGNKGEKLVTIGADIGGTKIAIGAGRKIGSKSGRSLFLEEVQIFPTSCKEIILPTESLFVREKFIIKLGTYILYVMKIMLERGYEIHPVIGIGSPGNFQSNMILPGTTPQFGHSFDNFKMRN
jgi:hypothetical protein